MATLTQAEKEPFLRWLAELLNTCYKIAGASMLTAVQAATSLDTLQSGIRALSVHAKDKAFFEQLNGALEHAHVYELFGSDLATENATIAAFTTINTADAATDMLYKLARQYDSTLTKRTRYGSFQRVGFGVS